MYWLRGNWSSIADVPLSSGGIVHCARPDSWIDVWCQVRTRGLREEVLVQTPAALSARLHIT